MTTKWFDVDKAGLAAILERRGKAFAIFELVSNAWDAGASDVAIELEPQPGVPFARLSVTDDSPEGWADLSDSFTMFSRSRRGSDPTKRGRFSLGEKLVLSLCRSASIATMQGTMVFYEDGTRRTMTTAKTSIGTRFECLIRMTRDEFTEAWEAIERMIPPHHADTTLNGRVLVRPVAAKIFKAKLPTEIADGEGVLRRTIRDSTVEVFNNPDPEGEILEMGIPVCAADFPFRVNVLAKIPLNMERDGVTTAFRRALQVAVLNEMADTLNHPELAAQPWVTEAIGDSRATAESVKQVIRSRFGERVVVASPHDPVANATAAATGAVVLHGGSLPANAWANIRKHSLIVSSAQAFPTPKPTATTPKPDCPTCGRPMP